MAKRRETAHEPRQPTQAVHGPQRPRQALYGMARLRQALGLAESDVSDDVACEEAAVRLETRESTGLRDPLDPDS
jgi:hypothetical protein